MNDKKLTEVVHPHVEVYDLLHPKYMDTTCTEKTWKEVEQEKKQEGNATNIFYKND
jgi:hypothetical protein